MKKSIVSLFLIGILLPFNPLFGASKSSSSFSSSKSSSSSSSSRSSSYGSSSSSKSSSYGSGSSSNYGSSSSSKSSSYGSGSSSNYGSSSSSKSSSYGSGSSSNLNAPSYGNASNTSNTLKKVATGAAIGVGAGAVANEIQNSSVKTEQPKPTSDVKKPELSSYEKMKADNIQKNNSVVDNTMKSSYKEPVKSNNTNTVNNTMKSSSYNSYSNNNYSNPYKDYSYRKKVYHYDTSVPYGSRYNSYGIGNYYGHSTMDYLPAMMLIYMLSNSNDSSDDYYAKQYYQERQNDVDMRQWREEMEAQSKDNKEIKDLLYRLDNANKPVDYNSSNYSNKIDGLSQQVSKDQKDFSSVSGTEIKPEQSDYTLKDEVLFISK